jgi:flavin reductase (DIM6/NTAB) family NADH-FMN oxidoreductase RutF
VPDRSDADSVAHVIRDFRRCVGSFATGVTVVATQHEGRLAGMTLNSFTSVSLEPLLVCVSLAERTRTLDLIRDSGRYAVSILGADQQGVASEFARAGADFPEQLVTVDSEGHVVVNGALALLRCRLFDLVAAGDHHLAIGEVLDFEASIGQPLVFHRGAFGELTARAA